MFKVHTSLPKNIEAVQFTADNKDQVFNSLTGQCGYGWEDAKPILKVTTIHGEIATVRLGDWIVKEAKPGFYYPIAESIFNSSYV